MTEGSTRLALHWQILIGMILGAILGIAVNHWGSSRNTVITSDLPPGVVRVDIMEQSGGFELSVTGDSTAPMPKLYRIGAIHSGPNAYRSLDDFRKTQPDLAKLYDVYGGTTASVLGLWFKRIGGLFLRLLQMVSVPLIVTSLLAGIMGLSGFGGVGRMFRRTLSYYLMTSMLAIVTGIFVVNLVRPGLGENARSLVDLNSGSTTGIESNSGGLAEVFFRQIETMIPSNPLAALVEPNFLSLIAFTIAFAVFALRVGGRTAAAIERASQVGLEVMMAMTTAIIGLAPIGVFFLMAYVTSTQGAAVFRSLAWYVLAVALGLFIHGCISLPLIVKWFAKRSPWAFAQAMSPALLTAFSSASSNGTLPLTITSAETRAGISNRTSSFVLPLGSTINMDGTALYEAVAVLFIAQLYHGANLPISQQIVVAFTALLASVGAAGIPHAGLVMMVIVLQAVGLPVELQGIILAVDRVLDMARTSVNVWSDCCGCAVIDHWEQMSHDPSSANPALANPISRS